MKHFIYFLAVLMGFALVASADASELDDLMAWEPPAEQAKADPTQVLHAMTKVLADTFEAHNERCVEYMFTQPIAPTAELMVSEYARCMGEHYLVFETFLISKHDEKYRDL